MDVNDGYVMQSGSGDPSTRFPMQKAADSEEDT